MRLTNDQYQLAINEAVHIDASPHEWPKEDKIWLLCNALLDANGLMHDSVQAIQKERDEARSALSALNARIDKVIAEYGDAETEYTIESLLEEYYNDFVRMATRRSDLLVMLESARIDNARLREALERIAAQAVFTDNEAQFALNITCSECGAWALQAAGIEAIRHDPDCHYGLAHSALATPAPNYRKVWELRAAAEELREIAKDKGIDGGKCYSVKAVYREFPDVLTERIGVVEGYDLIRRSEELDSEADAMEATE